MTIEGELAVRLGCDQRRVRSVAVRSTRPFAAARVLVGRAPDDAVCTAPRLFSVCARAQGAAAAAAIEAATGHGVDAPTLAAREVAVLLEAIEQYLWRLLIDWPRAAGRDADVAGVAAARRAIAPAAAGAPASGVGEALERVVARHVFGVAPGDWLEVADADALAAWARSTGTLPATLVAEQLTRRPPLGASDVALMPVPGRDDLRAIAAAVRAQPDFERAPSWHGAPAETGALARMRSHPIVAAVRERCGNAVPARMVARLAELAQLVLRIAGRAEGVPAPRWVDGLALDGDEGLGAVQTARGLLVHVASVDGARVAAYRIVAPTEWNFHPAGPLVRGLEGLDAADEAALVRDARLAVQALDPCVSCSVEVAHA